MVLFYLVTYVHFWVILNLFCFWEYAAQIGQTSTIAELLKGLFSKLKIFVYILGMTMLHVLTEHNLPFIVLMETCACYSISSLIYFKKLYSLQSITVPWLTGCWSWVVREYIKHRDSKQLKKKWSAFRFASPLPLTALHQKLSLCWTVRFSVYNTATCNFSNLFLLINCYRLGNPSA